MQYHGGDIYRNQIRLDFSVNTNPLGMPDSVREALHQAVEEAGYMDYLKVPYPSVTFTSEESIELSTLQIDLNNLVESQETRLIAKKDLTRADFDAFVADLKAARVDRYVEIYQNAYDRYMAE